MGRRLRKNDAYRGVRVFTIPALGGAPRRLTSTANAAAAERAEQAEQAEQGCARR